jgi:hypothetical protein
MNLDNPDADVPVQKTVYRRVSKEPCMFLSASGKSKVKVVDDRVWCQKIPYPIPAIISFSLPRGWEETQKPLGAVPGQHGHQYHPKDNRRVLLRFFCSGTRGLESERSLMRSVLYEEGHLPAVDDTVLKGLVWQALDSRVLSISSTKVIDWNGRKVIECEFIADAGEEVEFDNTNVKELKGWALIYDNSDSLDPKGGGPLPACVEFVAQDSDFMTHLQTVRFAAKTILWNKDWPPKK